LNGFISIQTDENCPWTVSSDAAWLNAPFGTLPLTGAGTTSRPLSVNVNTGPTRMATVAIRWPGGGVDLQVVQNGFGF
jgi:hypothetical protein